MSGDPVSTDGIGKTWEPGTFERLLGDVTSRLFEVDGDDTALGEERPQLAQWRERGW